MDATAGTPTVSDEDFGHILDATREFVRTVVVPRELEIMNDNRVPDDIREQTKEMGLFGYAIPQEWGGLGLDLTQDVELAMELGYTSLSLRSMFGTNNGIAGQVLVGFGTDEQKSTWLEKIATGPYNKKFKPNRTNYDWVTSKEEEVDRFVNDPLCGFPLTVQGYIDLGTLLYAINTDQWYRRVPKDLPILLISGENDPVGDMGKGVRRVFDKLNKTGHDVKLTLYPRIRHALITEMNSAQVYEDLYAFFSSHLPKAEEPVYEKETEAEPEVSTETEKSVENPAAEEEKETEAAVAEKYDDMPEENAELPVI